MSESIYVMPVWDTVKTAWSKVDGTKRTFWTALSLVFLIMFALGFTSQLVYLFSEDLGSFAHVIAQVVNYLFQMSLLYMGIQRANNKPISPNMVFHTFEPRIAISVVGLYIAEICIFVPLAIIMFTSANMYDANTMILSLVLCGIVYTLTIAASLFLAVRLSIAIAMILEKNANPIQAIKMSFQATRGNTMQLIGLFIIQITVIVISMIPLGIGLIWSLPLCYIIYGLIYKSLAVNIQNG